MMEEGMGTHVGGGVEESETGTVKHRYRTRSKLAGVRGWVQGGGGGGVGEGEGDVMEEEREESGPVFRGLKKRKRGVDNDEEFGTGKPQNQKMKTLSTLKRGQPRHHTGDPDETENDEFVPSSLTSRRTTRLSRSTSNSNYSSSPRPNTKSKPKPNPRSKIDPQPNPVTLQPTNSIPNLRTFPPHTPYHPTFPLFYRRFPARSQLENVSPPSSAYVPFPLLTSPLLPTNFALISTAPPKTN
jgi:hypothetical protein